MNEKGLGEIAVSATPCFTSHSPDIDCKTVYQTSKEDTMYLKSAFIRCILISSLQNTERGKVLLH